MIVRQNHRREKFSSTTSPMNLRNENSSNGNNNGINKKTRRNGTSHSTIILVLACFLSSVVSFYAGIFVGMHMESSSDPSVPESMVRSTSRRANEQSTKPENILNPNSNDNNKSDWEKTQRPEAATLPKNREDLIQERKLEYLRNHRGSKGIFLPGTDYVDRDDFIQTFESLGVPFDPTERKINDRVMILYGDPSSYPDDETILHSNSTYFENDRGILDPKHPNQRVGVILSVEEATKNCHNLHVVLTDQHRPHQCIAILGQYESFHVHKWMRASTEPDPNYNSKDRFEINTSHPLRPVNRGMKTDGGRSVLIPTDKHFRANWESLARYLQSVDTVLKELEPIARIVTETNNRNTVVIMVCNFGQSELLMNFVCNARARGLGAELSNILLFPTDKETHEIATKVLGLTSFYSEEIFGNMPKNAANAYGDDVFRKMMFAKVFCVHLVSMLGHDFLFQDVDVVWYKDPLQFFHNDGKATIADNEKHPSQNYDMFFQDDGNRGTYYAPYAANTGFYFVKNNSKTKAFFNSLLLSGDMILSNYSHQIALVQLLSEHASLYGLNVKIWNRQTQEFPGGHSFHMQPDTMKKIAQGEITPYIFHMSWTENKSNKVKFMQQMGMWYVRETCRNKSTIDLENSGSREENHDCCLSEPVIQCHYKDKPSIIPCPDSPFIDQGGKSFW